MVFSAKTPSQRKSKNRFSLPCPKGQSFRKTLGTPHEFYTPSIIHVPPASTNPFLTFLFATPPLPIRMNARSQNIEDHWQHPIQITHLELEANANGVNTGTRDRTGDLQRVRLTS